MSFLVDSPPLCPDYGTVELSAGGMKRFYTDLSLEVSAFWPGAVPLVDFAVSAQRYLVKLLPYDVENLGRV